MTKHITKLHVESKNGVCINKHVYRSGRVKYVATWKVDGKQCRCSEISLTKLRKTVLFQVLSAGYKP